METKLIYLEDSYKKSNISRIVDIKEDRGISTVVLDETIFFAEGGGQPSDQGVIAGKKGKLTVEQVILRGNNIEHIGKLEGTLKIKESVDITLDWDRRYHNMKVHTAGHIVHEAVKHIFPELEPIEAEHGKRAYIKYIGNLEEISEGLILNKANQIIEEGLPIKTEFVTLEELKKRSPWVPEHLPRNKPLRIISIGNFPPIPDGGTQLKNTKEVGSISYIQITNLGQECMVLYRLTDSISDSKKTEQTQKNFTSSISSESLISIKNQALARIMDAKDESELEQIRIELFGKQGHITQATRGLRNLSSQEKKQMGILINELKNTLEKISSEKKNGMGENIREWFDPTIPVTPHKVGSLHPTSIVISEMSEIFKSLGFSLYEGPEIETDHYNFELLNLPKDHPARSLQDVLYIDEPEVLLRSHTSSVETRGIENLTPPFRVVVAGKCYRFENVNASNNAMFYQFQGFALQKGLSLSDLKGTLFYFVKSYFGEERKIRFRCKYYPEVEPGVGLDLDCTFCNQKGCAVCKGRGWLEMLGAGMIHPNILKNFGYNPKDISGFAFGMGLDRIVMDRFKIQDIRSLYNGDIKYE